jgi:hypothetical protein
MESEEGEPASVSISLGRSTMLLIDGGRVNLL